MPEMFTTKQVALMFSVSEQTVDRWRKRRELASIQVGTGQPRFKRTAIDEFIAANEKARLAHA